MLWLTLLFLSVRQRKVKMSIARNQLTKANKHMHTIQCPLIPYFRVKIQINESIYKSIHTVHQAPPQLYYELQRFLTNNFSLRLICHLIAIKEIWNINKSLSTFIFCVFILTDFILQKYKIKESVLCFYLSVHKNRLGHFLFCYLFSNKWIELNFSRINHIIYISG